MRKVVLCFVFAIVVFAIGVLADQGDVREEIREIGEERGFVIEDEDIREINFSDLPGELDIEEVGDTEIAIYEVNYSDRPFFVISAGGMFEPEPEVVVGDVRMLLHFGFAGERGGSGFLNMAGGSLGSLERGYVMMRRGSVTGISTSLDVVDFVEGGYVEIVIYKNGEEVGFRNVLGADLGGVEIDYDVLSRDVVSFEAGDVLSVYVRSGEDISLAGITTVLEITN